MKHLPSEYRELGQQAALAVNDGDDTIAHWHNERMTVWLAEEETKEDRQQARVSFEKGYLEKSLNYPHKI